jgi:lysophospholipase L1-like esterase
VSAADDGVRSDRGAESGGSADTTAGVRFVGRVDTSDPAGPRFSWPGTTILARFTGSSIGVRLRDAGNLYHVILDGRPLDTLVTSAGRDRYPLASGLGPGPHQLALHRRTEGFVGESQFLGLLLEETGTPLAPPPPAARRLEFVGDSITCGYGIEAPNQHCPFTPATENHHLAFAALTTRALGAEAITIAYSGKGMYRNYGGDLTDTVPMLYDRTLVDGGLPWDFARFVPDAVVINLGTNDFARGDPGQPFADAYATFVRRVRSHYPKSYILCTLGPMLGADQLARTKAHLQPTLHGARAAGDDRVSLLEFTPQDGATGFGCDWHPSRATNQRMAAELTAELRRVLNW